MTENLVSSKLVCVALNDTTQRAAMAAAFTDAPYKQAPTQPVLYYKPRNTWNTHGQVVPWAIGGDGGAADAMVVGGSLGVVIGKTACRVSAEQALSYVQGYTLVADYSLPEVSYYRPDIRGKCQDGTAPVGPQVTTADAITDPDALEVLVHVNGACQSHFPLSRLHDNVANIIAKLSHIMTLQPGEVIATGFCGERTPVQPGDTVAIEIGAIGTLVNTLGERAA
ncbi:MAG TPA: 5-carboxymethyl-2-oxo-hex-3- ene-1,7-dioate decarboxylase [Gammaproteobacteria bacterium]|nr:5-carboxymethyl-2-oxo-hex-3- ene-1,7-dioate decarboxylase [Gammaproteobacteria bacterium]